MREAIILDGSEPVNVIVLDDGDKGDAYLSATCVEITGLDPKPGVGTGWSYVKGAFVPPVLPPLTREETEAARRTRYQIETDGIYFDAVANGKPLDEWKTARNQVKTDLPNPPEVKR